MILDGAICSEALDSSGEILDIDGADISDWEKGTLLANWDHTPGESGADSIVGVFTYCKKIFKESDCENDRQRMYWKKVKLPYIYGICRLFDGAGHDKAKALAAIVRDNAANNEPLVCRWSVEGSVLERDGNRLVSSVFRRVAVTPKPCNRTALSGLLDDPNAPEGYKKSHAPKRDILDFESATKHEHPMFARLGGATNIECNPILEDVAKSTEAGSYNAAPSTLTGGAALQREDLSLMRRKAVKTLQEYSKPFSKEEFKAALKHDLPEASDDFIDHFVDAAEEFHVKKKLLKKEGDAPSVEAPAPAKAAAKPPAPKAVAKPKAKPAAKPKAKATGDESESVVKITQGTIRGIPCQPVKMTGVKFEARPDGSAILHTPKGSFPLYNPDKGFGVKTAKVKKPEYRGGVLHVPEGTDLSKVPHNAPNPGFREIYNSAPIEDFHSGKVMPNWTHVHELTKAGKLPEEVVMHSAHFSMMSPNTPIATHELMHSHAVDAWEDHGVDPRDPDYASTVGLDWLKRDQAKNYPRTAGEYFRTRPGVHIGTDSETTGRKAGDIGGFMLANNKLENVSNYPALHPVLVDMVKRHGVDARGATKELMAHKALQNNWKGRRQIAKTKIKAVLAAKGLTDEKTDFINNTMKEGPKLAGGSKEMYAKLKATKAQAKKLGLKDSLSETAEAQLAAHPDFSSYRGVQVNGLAPKTGRFTFTMLGGGNSFVPDTHMVRHLFGMDAAKDGNSLAYLKSVLWNENNHHVLENMDKWYANNHPATEVMQNHPTWGKHFADDKEQANFPAFWRHWCTIAQDERNRGMSNSAANEFSTHEPFWMGIGKYLNKAELNSGLLKKLLALHAQYGEDFGEVPAQMMFFHHIVPHLMEAAKIREKHDEPVDFIKSDLLKAQRLDVELRKASMEPQSAPSESPEHPVVHTVSAKLSDNFHPIGRYAISDGNITHLEDYHGLMGKLVPQGPVNQKTVSQLHGLRMSPYIQISSSHPPVDPANDTVTPIVPQDRAPSAVAAPIARPPSVFHYQRAGHDAPHVLEVSQGKYLLDGNELAPHEVHAVMGNVKSGAGSIRYIGPKASDRVAKAESLLRKSDDPTDPLHAALMAVRESVKAGHMKQEHADALTRHIYEDPMTPGIGNKFAATQFLGQKKPGVYAQLDGNSFRSINNGYGHAAGDEAIKAFGKYAREAMDETTGRGPSGGKIFRNGGDEFVAHFPSHEHAAAFARSVSQKLDSHPPIGGAHKLSMSFGFGLDPHTADAALYKAKEQKFHPGTKVPKYEVGQEPNLVHSHVPGFEGPVPLADPQAAAHQHVMSQVKLPSTNQPSEPR